MTIPPISNQDTETCYLTFIAKKIPCELFERVYIVLNSQDLKNFVSSCKCIKQLDHKFKKTYEKGYDKLMSQVFSNSFGSKSMSELSMDMVNFCEKGEFLQLKALLDSLMICGKFHEVDKGNLDKTFSLCCTNDNPNMMRLFMQSGGFRYISIDRLNLSVENSYLHTWSSLNDNAILQTIIKSDRYNEISLENLENALEYASKYSYPGIIRAVMESTQRDMMKLSPKSLGVTLKHASINGYLDVVRAIMESTRYNEISLESLGTALEHASKNGHLDIVRLFIQSSRFHDISIDCLNKCIGQSFSDNSATIQILIKSGRFYEISPESLEIALGIASSNGCPGVVKAIMESMQYDKISTESLGNALVYASNNGHLDIVRLFIQSNRFHDISIDCLNGCLIVANNSAIIQILIESDRFYKINPESLGIALETASQLGYLDHVKVIMQSKRYDEINPKNLGFALKNASRKGHLDIVHLFIQSGRFHNISIDYINQCLVVVANRAIIQTLIESDRFYEISSDSLGVALKNASRKGHVNIVKAIIESPRSDEITLSDFTRSFINAMQTKGQSESDNRDFLEIVRALANDPKHYKITPNDYKKALEGASSCKIEALKYLRENCNGKESFIAKETTTKVSAVG